MKPPTAVLGALALVFVAGLVQAAAPQGGAEENVPSSTRSGTSVGYFVPYFAAADRAAPGFMRIVNRSERGGAITIVATDDRGDSYAPVTLDIGAGEAKHFNAYDLERGNAAKGLRGRVGDRNGNWRLTLTTTLDIVPLAFLRNATGIVIPVAVLKVGGQSPQPPEPPPPGTGHAPADPKAFFERVEGKKFVVRPADGSETAEYRFTGDYLGCSFCPDGRFTALFSSGETERGSWEYTKGLLHRAALKLDFGFQTGECYPVNLLFTSRNTGRFSAVCTGDIGGGNGTFRIEDIF